MRVQAAFDADLDTLGLRHRRRVVECGRRGSRLRRLLAASATVYTYFASMAEGDPADGESSFTFNGAITGGADADLSAAPLKRFFRNIESAAVALSITVGLLVLWGKVVGAPAIAEILSHQGVRTDPRYAGALERI